MGKRSLVPRAESLAFTIHSSEFFLEEVAGSLELDLAGTVFMPPPKKIFFSILMVIGGDLWARSHFIRHVSAWASGPPNSCLLGLCSAHVLQFMIVREQGPPAPLI